MKINLEILDKISSQFTKIFMLELTRFSLRRGQHCNAFKTVQNKRLNICVLQNMELCISPNR